MNSIERLSEIFSKFPGIGPRQARRFVYFLLTRQGDYTKNLVQAIENLDGEIRQCSQCLRFYARNGSQLDSCAICADDTRDNSRLCVVPRDIDFESIEKSGSYNGYYFVLGGVVPILKKEPEKRVRISDLQKTINDRVKTGLKEVILAMNANNDGENTAEYLKQELTTNNKQITISMLGRGLSTGAELEYADPETLKNAFNNRA